MSLNQKIILNLENLFNNNFKEIQHPSLVQWLDLMKTENPDTFFVNEQRFNKLYDESMLSNFERAKENAKLVECYEKAIELALDETKIINAFSNDLKSSFQKIKNGIKNIEDSKIQIIILTYDFEPYAWIGGFGEGNYPILKKPEYFDFNYKKSFFEILGHVDYSKVWSNLIKLEEYLEEAKIYDDVSETDFYQNLRNCYIFKTYLLLNKAFKLNQEELFSDLDIKKPLFVYGNQHDGEKINIFCYE